MDERILRLDCLRLAIDTTTANRGDRDSILELAKKYADFVIANKVEEQGDE